MVIKITHFSAAGAFLISETKTCWFKFVHTVYVYVHKSKTAAVLKLEKVMLVLDGE